jgi:thiamine-monophosphate kinase
VVSGTIGDAALGLLLRRGAGSRRWKLDRAALAHLTARYLVPQPRNALAQAVRHYASAAMDVSDGLVGDLGKLCAASGATAAIEVARVPLSEAARKVVAAEPARIETVLTGGDDYEIVCTVAPEKLAPFCAAANAAGVAVTEIGSIVARRALPEFLDRNGKALRFKQASFSHF